VNAHILGKRKRTAARVSDRERVAILPELRIGIEVQDTRTGMRFFALDQKTVGFTADGILRCSVREWKLVAAIFVIFMLTSKPAWLCEFKISGRPARRR